MTVPHLVTKLLQIIKPIHLIKLIQIQIPIAKPTLIIKQVVIQTLHQQVGINYHILSILHMLIVLQPGGETIFWLV